MAEKRHLPPVPEIPELCLKYMFFMAYIRSASPETLRSYGSDLAQAFNLKPGFLELPLETAADQKRSSNEPTQPQLKLDSDAVLSLCRDALSRWTHLSPASRNRKAACLKSFMNWLLQEEVIDRDLASQIHSPKVPIRLPHHLSVDEAIALLDAIRRDIAEAETETQANQGKRDLALILLLYGGGLRVSEACGLEWSRVDRAQRVLRIKGKGGAERIIVLPPMAIAALEGLSRTSTFVFGDVPLSTRVAYEIVRSRGARAGLLQPLHPHALRHSYATHLLTSGANLRTLQELLGHRTLQATQRYTHIGIDQLARTLESFHPLGSEPLGKPPKSKRR